MTLLRSRPQTDLQRRLQPSDRVQVWPYSAVEHVQQCSVAHACCSGNRTDTALAYCGAQVEYKLSGDLTEWIVRRVFRPGRTCELTRLRSRVLGHGHSVEVSNGHERFIGQPLRQSKALDAR